MAISSKRPVTEARFAELIAPLIGKRITHSWRGHGSAIFLELGLLHQSRSRRQPHGEATIMIQWSWRIEKARSIQTGSWSSERRITSGVRALKGRRIVDVAVEGRLPELNLRLNAGIWVHSFATAEGQP